MTQSLALLAALIFMTACFPVPAQTAFPVVDSSTQTARDATRRQILQAELATEKTAIEEDQHALTEATLARVSEAKLALWREDAHRHAANVTALSREISALEKPHAPVIANAPARLSGKAVHPAATPADAAPFWDVYKRTQGKPAEATNGREVP